MKKVFNLLVCLFLTFQITQAQTIYVDFVKGNNENPGTASTNPVQTIGYAISLISSSGTINIASGTSTFASFIDFTDKNIEFVGNGVVLTGNTRKFAIRGSSKVTFKGLTFQNGSASGIAGGAIYFIGDSLGIDSCRFLNNSAAAGGAIYSSGRSLGVNHSYFEGNAVDSTTSNPPTANGSGGAIVHNGKKSETGNFILHNSTFYQNKTTQITAGNDGTAVYVKAYDLSNQHPVIPEIEIINCLFYGNVASRTNDYGQEPALSLFLRNATDKATIINNTFWKNRSYNGTTSGSGFRLTSATQGTVYFVNNVIAGGGLGIVTNNNTSSRKAIEGWNNVIYGTNKAFGSNVNDPCFLSGNSNGNILAAATVATVEEHNALYLNEAAFNTTTNAVPCISIINETSPLVNAGLSSKTMDGKELVPTVDITGRTNNGLKDIGCYEYYPQTPTTVNTPFSKSALTAISRSNDQTLIKNLTQGSLKIDVYTVQGSLVQSATFTDNYLISGNKGVLILIIRGEAGTETHKLVI